MWHSYLWGMQEREAGGKAQVSEGAGAELCWGWLSATLARRAPPWASWVWDEVPRGPMGAYLPREALQKEQGLLPTQSCLYFTGSLGHRLPPWLTSWMGGPRTTAFLPRGVLTRSPRSSAGGDRLLRPKWCRTRKAIVSVQEGPREAQGLVQCHPESQCCR